MPMTGSKHSRRIRGLENRSRRVGHGVRQVCQVGQMGLAARVRQVARVAQVGRVRRVERRRSMGWVWTGQRANNRVWTWRMLIPVNDSRL